jgi:uncharacterized SAM-binding protein YcdF (DUF218 family)
MFFALSKILDLAASPVVWVLVLTAYIAVKQRKARRSRRTRLLFYVPLAACALLYFFSIEPAANALTRTLERSTPDTIDQGATYDAVIVLGGMVDSQAVETYGSPSYNNNVERFLAAYSLLRSGRARYAIITGGVLDPKVKDGSETAVIARALESWGIEHERLILEPKALNTRENAVYAAEIVRARGFSRVLMVTSAIHMKRAAGCFRAVGLRVDTLKVDYRGYDPDRFSGSWLPRPERLSESTTALREHLGWLVYRARGYAVP